MLISTLLALWIVCSFAPLTPALHLALTNERASRKQRLNNLLKHGDSLSYWSPNVQRNMVLSYKSQLHEKSGDETEPELMNSAFTDERQDVVVVALTREAGKNDKLRRLIQSNAMTENTNTMVDGTTGRSPLMQIVELPCIEHTDGPDLSSLAPTLRAKIYDYVAITSPEAATVFASECGVDMGRASRGFRKVAAVGSATKQQLLLHGMTVDFVPTKATAETLCKELPPLSDDTASTTSVLYPASYRAKSTLQDGLSARGFRVTRLNTYDTVAATWSEDDKQVARNVKVVCFASPSAVKAWVSNLGGDSCQRIPAACIGETSAKACVKWGWKEKDIFYPDKPGVDGWAESVFAAIRSFSS